MLLDISGHILKILARFLKILACGGSVCMSRVNAKRTHQHSFLLLPCSDLSSPSPTSFHSASAAARVDGSDIVVLQVNPTCFDVDVLDSILLVPIPT